MTSSPNPAFRPTDPYQPHRGYPTAPSPYGGMSGGHGPYGGGPAAYGGAMPRPRRFSDINANWGWVVVACLCFWPLGFAAASAAGRVVPALLDGDAGRAQDEAGRARKLGIVALCITVGLLVLFSAWLIVSAANGTFDCPTDDPYC